MSTLCPCVVFVCVDKEGNRGMTTAGTRRPFSSLIQLNLSAGSYCCDWRRTNRKFKRITFSAIIIILCICISVGLLGFFFYIQVQILKLLIAATKFSLDPELIVCHHRGQYFKNCQRLNHQHVKSIADNALIDRLKLILQNKTQLLSHLVHIWCAHNNICRGRKKLLSQVCWKVKRKNNRKWWGECLKEDEEKVKPKQTQTTEWWVKREAREIWSGKRASLTVSFFLLLHEPLKKPLSWQVIVHITAHQMHVEHHFHPLNTHKQQNVCI